MFYQIFLSPQVKQWAIITYKHGIYELPHELPDNLSIQISEKCLKLIEWQPIAQSPCQNESFVNTSRKFLKNRS